MEPKVVPPICNRYDYIFNLRMVDVLNTRILVVVLFAWFGFTGRFVAHAQETSPAESTTQEQSAVRSNPSPLPEAPTVARLSNSDSSTTDNAGSSKDAAPHAEAAVTLPPPPTPTPHRSKPAREIAIESYVSYGNWQIFAAGESESLYWSGIEYDRNSWDHFLGAQMDYVAEILPFVLLKQPRVLDKWGNRVSKDDVYLHGIGFSPIGLRMQWRSNKAIKPYFTVKGGAVAFTQKALSPDATYQNFSMSESIGFYARVSERWDMRVGLFGDYHFSNAFITSYNPGLDVMNSSIAFSYHLGGTGGATK
jgi:hypothetical protein